MFGRTTPKNITYCHRSAVFTVIYDIFKFKDVALLFPLVHFGWSDFKGNDLRTWLPCCIRFSILTLDALWLSFLGNSPFS